MIRVGGYWVSSIKQNLFCFTLLSLLVSSIEPLRAYILPHAYLKIAKSNKYDPGHKYFNDKCMHITNNRIQAKCPQNHEENAFMPFDMFDPRFIQMMTDSLGMDLYNFFDFEHFVSKTRLAILKSLLLMLPKLKEFRTKWTIARTFQLLAYDIIFDDFRGVLCRMLQFKSSI